MESKEIKKLRKKMKLSQQAFATRLGVGIMSVSRWERGEANPSNMANEKLENLVNEVGQYKKEA